MKIGLIIPVYNEENRLPESLTKLKVFLKQTELSIEVYFVDDGSHDSSANIINEFISENNQNCHLIQIPHRGKAYAVKKGVLSIDTDIIIFSDIDFSTPLETIEKTVRVIPSQADIVIGSREINGSKRLNEPFYRHILGRGFNMIVRVITGLQVQDTQCGYKAFSRTVAHKIFQRLIVYSGEGQIQKKPYLGAFDVEVLVIAQSLGAKIFELPIVWEHKPTNNLAAINDSLKMLFDVLKIGMNKIRNKYK